MGKSLDDNIRGLTYDERTILASKGEKVSSFVPAEERFEENKYIVVKRVKKKIEDSIGFDLGVAESVISKAFPGSLVKVNSDLVDNNPHILVTDRKPMNFRVGLNGMGEDAEFTVSDPNYRTVYTGIDKVLAKYKGQELPARITFKGSMAYSESQLEAEFGLEMKDVKKSLKIDFSSVFSKKKTVYIMSFRQTFYTVTADIPKNPSDVFADSVTWESLEKKHGVNDKNPPGLVYQVGYGRAVYVKIESSEQSMDVEAALKASINNNLEVTTNTKYKDILKNCNFSAVVLGGGAEEHTKIIACKNIEEIKKIITDNSKYSKDNPGYPLFYNVIFLKDNNNALTLNSTEYIETKSEIHESGIIKMSHTGWYVAQFKIEWEEVSYKEGRKEITHKSWNSGDLTAPTTREKVLAGNCRNIKIKAWGHTGFKWRDTFERSNIPLIPSRTFSIWGTTLNQQYSIDPNV